MRWHGLAWHDMGTRWGPNGEGWRVANDMGWDETGWDGTGWNSKYCWSPPCRV